MPHDQTAELLRQYRAHLMRFAPSQVPDEDMMPADEYKVRSIEEQQLLFDRFFDPKHCRIEDDGFMSQQRNNYKNGNMATVYLWFVDTTDDAKLIDIRHIFSPLRRSLTRRQWSLFIDISIVCHVYWQWLPSIRKSFKSEAFDFHRAIGWTLYDQTIYSIDEFIVLNQKEEREWIGEFLLNVNSISHSQRINA